MATTSIEWATRSWNFTRGCRRVSPGCGTGREGGCYAERQAARFAYPGGPYEGLVEVGKHGPRWTGKGLFVAEKLAEPLHVRAPKDGSRVRFFVDSMSDLFFEEFSNEQIAAGFGVMAACPQHDFLILTKRAERLPEWFAWAAREGEKNAPGDPFSPWWTVTTCLGAAGRVLGDVPLGAGGQTWPLPNVWLGVSAENQATADERIPHLLNTPAAVRWISAEPLIGPVRLDDIGDGHGGCIKPLVGLHWVPTERGMELVGGRGPAISWVVAGGESGPGARACDVGWIRSIVQQCKAASVPAFVKQVGSGLGLHTILGRGRHVKDSDKEPGGFIVKSSKGGDPAEWPEDIRVREFPR